MPKTALELYGDYSQAKSRIKTLISDWATEITKSDVRRQLRKLEIDLDQMRDNKEIEQDETFIPVRVIDDNIRKEQPSYVSFLVQSNKLLAMMDIKAPGNNTTDLEAELTKGLKYHGWDLPWQACIDGTQLHGWDAIEVCFDQSKPLNVSLEHVGHDSLFFASDSIDLQNAPFIVRKYYMTELQLTTIKGFDPKQVEQLCDYLQTAKVSVVEVYKIMFKHEGIVYVEWDAKEKTDNWLKAPMPLYQGRRQQTQTLTIDPMTGIPMPQMQWTEVYETMYPIFVLPYNRTEQKKIFDCVGRCFLDTFRQEAQTALVTSFINGTIRASGVYASIEGTASSGGTPKQDTKLQTGGIYDTPMKFWHPDYPDAQSCLGGLNYLDTKGSLELGQMTDVLRKKRGEKTATEYSVAQQDMAFLASTQVSLFSSHVRDVYTYSWSIIQSQALQGLITLLPTQQQDGSFKNDMVRIARDYDIRAAGDTEVVQKYQRLSNMMQLWPMIANTPLAQIFLVDIIDIMLPENSIKYKQALAQPSPLPLLGGLTGVLTEMVKEHPEIVQTLPPELQQNMQQLLTTAHQYVDQQSPAQPAGQRQQ